MQLGSPPPERFAELVPVVAVVATLTGKRMEKLPTAAPAATVQPPVAPPDEGQPDSTAVPATIVGVPLSTMLAGNVSAMLIGAVVGAVPTFTTSV